MRYIIAVLLMVTGLLEAQQSNCTTFSPIVNTTRFILVVDVSGSMYGKPLDDAKLGLNAFVDQMEPGDEAALLAFSDDIYMTQAMTSDVNRLRKGIQSLQTIGGTHLYDAVAKAIDLSKNYSEKTAIVLLTDGQDGGSKFTARNIESMVAYHGIAFYAIGLGSVDDQALKTLAKKTSGEFDPTPNSSDLQKLYANTMRVYKKKHVSGGEDTAQLLVHSMPGGRPVFLDGQNFGKTPLKIINIQPGEHTVRVQFDVGPWECKSSYSAGKLGKVTAIESEVNKNIAVISIPHGTAVFLDEEFQGYTSNFAEKSTTETKGFLFKRTETTVDYSRELIIENVPKGKHILTLVPFADSEVSDIFDRLDYSFVMGAQNLIISADARTGQAVSEETKSVLKAKANRFQLDESNIFDDF